MQNITIRPFLDPLASIDIRQLSIQLAVVAVCAIGAAILCMVVRRMDGTLAQFLKRFGSKRLGLLAFATGLWVAHFGILGFELEGTILRLTAIAVTLYLAATLALDMVGKTPLGWLIVTIACVIATLAAFHLIDPTVAALDANGIYAGALKITPWFIIKAIVTIGGLAWGAQRLGDLIDRGLSSEQVFSRSSAVLLMKFVRAALIVAALILSLAVLGVNITTLAMLSGAIGLGLGFGLQKVVSNYVAGLILLMDKSIKPGDVIEVEFAGDKIRGEVTMLAGRFTAITLRTGTETLIPNELLISAPVSNWSHTSPNVQLRIPVGVAYTTNVELAMKLCVEAAQSVSRVLSTPSPVCLIVGFGDSAVDLNVRFWINNPEGGVRNVSSDVYLQIWKRFHEANIEIPFPQRDIHIRSSVGLPPPTGDSPA